MKPTVKANKVDGNIFAVMGAAKKALENAGERAKAKEMGDRVFKSNSYEQALDIIHEYVEFDFSG